MKTSILTTIIILISFNIMAYECIITDNIRFDEKTGNILMSPSICVANKLNNKLECKGECKTVKCPDKAINIESIVPHKGELYKVSICEFGD